MEINLKPMIETAFGNSYDFLALAKMDADTADNLAKQLLVQEGHTVPVPPVLEAVPSEPQAERKIYFGITFKWENNSDMTYLAFECAEDVKRVSDAFNAAIGRIAYKDYGNKSINERSGKFCGVESESFSIPQYTEEQKFIKKGINETKERNRQLQDAYDESCDELNKSREYVMEARNKARDVVDSLDLLARTFKSTDDIVNDPEKTMELIKKNHREKLISIISQMVGGEEALHQNEDEAFDAFFPKLTIFIQERAAALA